MKENLHDIDKLFKTALEDHQEAPSAGVWNSIDKNLDKKGVVDINRKYIQLKRIAIALLILLLGAGVYTLNTWKTNKDQAKRNNKTNNEQNNGAVNLKDAQNKEDKIIAPGIINADKNIVIENHNKDSIKHIPNNNEDAIAADVTTNPALPKPSSQAGKTSLNKHPGRKIIINKSTKKNIITNADYGEVENEMLNTISVKDENEKPGNLSILSPINPELIKPAPKGILSVSNILGDELKVNALRYKVTKVKNAKSFAATVFFAPNISSNNIKNDKYERRPGRPFDMRDRDKIRNGEKHQFSYTLGVLIDYNINKHWGLQSGISLFNKTIRINPKTIYADVDNNGDVKYLYNFSSGYLFLSSKSVTNPAVGDSIQAYESTNTLQYASIPLAVKYTFSLKKIDLFASVGSSVNILTRGKIETEIANGLNKEANTSTKINGLKPSYFGGYISIGASYNITDRIAFSFLPSYNFALTSGTKDATVKSYPNTISLAAGIRYKL